jgi:hypothetical protein
MQGRTHSQIDQLSLRMCRTCGCTDALLQTAAWALEDEVGFRMFSINCPECGCDLEERPPMSYAEMEGLHDTLLHSRADGWAEALESRLIERWVGTSFVVLLAAILLFSMLFN